jgi:hypothetical protein
MWRRQIGFDAVVASHAIDHRSTAEEGDGVSTMANLVTRWSSPQADAMCAR